ncbi:hypothetical protein N8751_00315 [bacterium]|nr:hypothetical protein [bacterium]
MSFAQRLIYGRGRGRTVTFDAMDRAAALSERVEDSQPMWKWVRENNKQPKYFSDWPSVIQEYHQAVGTPWIKDYSVPTPYGEMGYDTIKPPKVEVKSGLITFPCEEKDDEKNLDWILDMMESDSDSDDDDESDFSDDEEKEEDKDEEKASNELPANDEIKFDVTSNLFSSSPSVEKTVEEESDGELSLISDSDDSDCEDYAPLMECDYKCGGTPIDPNCLEDGELNLAEEGGGYAHCHCHAAAEEKGLTLKQIPKGTNIRDLPEGTRLEHLPRGAVITINESDIEWGSDIEISDDEEESNVQNLETAIAENKVAVRKCKCGSSSHRRRSHSSCPLNKKNKL